MRTLIKFCGCTGPSDVIAAAEAGADAIGLIFAPSPRRITEQTAREIARSLPPDVMPVGVFVNPAHDDLSRVQEIFPHLVFQLHGDETPGFVASVKAKVIKALHVNPDETDASELERVAARHSNSLILFDTKSERERGGTGTAFPWQLIAPIARVREVIVSGGLTPRNVAACIREVRPFGVDVRSGIETDARKDPVLMREFVRSVREANAA